MNSCSQLDLNRKPVDKQIDLPLSSQTFLLATQLLLLILCNVKKYFVLLAGIAQRTECQPVVRVTSSILNQGTYLGCRPGPQGGACKKQPHIHVSLPLFLPPIPSLQKYINKMLKNIFCPKKQKYQLTFKMMVS